MRNVYSKSISIILIFSLIIMNALPFIAEVNAAETSVIDRTNFDAYVDAGVVDAPTEFPLTAVHVSKTPVKQQIYATGFDQYQDLLSGTGDGVKKDIIGTLTDDPWSNDGTLLYYKTPPANSSYIRSLPTSARLYRDNAMTLRLSTAVYGELLISYWYRTHDANGMFPLHLEWSPDGGETWKLADTIINASASFTQRNIIIDDPAASDNAHFQLRFRAELGTGSVYVDDLMVSGEPLQIIPVTGMTLNNSNTSIALNQVTRLSVAQVTPANATGVSVKWSSSNEAVATVNPATGLVSPVTAGTANITATNLITGVQATSTVEVKNEYAFVPVETVTIPEASYSLFPGQTIPVSALVSPFNATNKAINWAIENSGVATVDEHGNVTGVSTGTTTLRATADDNTTVYAEAAISVVEEAATARKITSFGFENPKSSGIIDMNEGTITVKVPQGTNLNALKALFYTTGTGVYVNGVEQISGVSSQNFSQPVTYEVRGVSNTVNTFTVIVEHRETSSVEKTWIVNNVDELVAANKLALPGDRIIMKNGTWNDVDFIFSGDGEEGKPITLQAETQGQVKIEGASRLTVAGTYLIVDGLTFQDESDWKPYGAITFDFLSYKSRLTNTVIDNFNPTNLLKPTGPGEDTKHPWVVNKGTYNRFDHNAFTRKGFTGEMMRMFKGIEHHAQIDHNYFGDRVEDTANGTEAIQIGVQPDTQDKEWGSNNSFTVIEHNYFNNWLGEIEIVSFKTSNNTFRYNTIENSPGTVTLRISNQIDVYGNFFLQNGTAGSGGVRVYGSGHQIYNNYFQGTSGQGDQRVAIALQAGLDDPTSKLDPQPVKDTLVAFNTFVDCKSNCITLGASNAGRPVAPDNIIIANNVAFNSPGITGTIIRQNLAPTNSVMHGNMYYGAELGIAQNDNEFKKVDPMLQKDSNGIYRPSVNSPVIGAAQGNYSMIDIDMDGQPRTAGAYDVGADQVSDDPVVLKPLTRADVGPVLPASDARHNR